MSEDQTSYDSGAAKERTIQTSETFNICATAMGGEIMTEFKITLRFSDDAKPSSVIIDGIEISDPKVAGIVQRAISGVASGHH